MSTFASLDSAVQTDLSTAVDGGCRPAMAAIARIRPVLEGYRNTLLMSPSGLPSTVASPAPDSRAAKMATLDAGQSIPPGANPPAGVGPVLVAQAIADLVVIDNLLSAYYTPALCQQRTQYTGPGMGAY